MFDVGADLSQVTVDSSTGDTVVFVGGLNTVMHLSANLTRLNKLTVGPKRDSLDCVPWQESVCSGIMAANEVKVLEVDRTTQKLLVCGSVRQGVCTLHSLRNLSNFAQIADTSVSNFLGSKKSVVVHFDNAIDQGLLFVGQEYDGRDLALSPNVFSTRQLNMGNPNEIVFATRNEEAGIISALGIRPDIKRTYHMEFIDILQDSNYVYYLTLQQESDQEPDTPYPRLGRICLRDPVYISYIEMGLLCEHERKEYRKILDAVLHDDVLYFSAAQTLAQQPYEVDPEKGSVICAVPVGTLNVQFTQANYECYFQTAQESPRVPSWRKENTKCRYYDPVNIIFISQWLLSCTPVVLPQRVKVYHVHHSYNLFF